MLERLQLRVAEFQHHIEVVDRPFHDGRVDDEINILHAKADILKHAKADADALVASMQDRLRVGEITDVDLLNVQIKAASAASAFLDADLASRHAERKRNDMADKLSITRNTLRYEQTYLSMIANSLTIISQISGTFVVAVARGSFVRRGHILGTINDH